MIRDLTGVDIRPTREFPVDPTNQAGFDNTGESLAMSPALLKKYLTAARHIAEHVVLKPEGFIFAPHPVVTETDRGRLAAMPEGNSTVLDHSCLLFISSMWSGSRHDSSKVPVLLLGGFDGALTTGRVLDYTDRGNDNRKLCSLYLSLLNRLGVRSDRFGDATAPLAGL